MEIQNSHELILYLASLVTYTPLFLFTMAAVALLKQAYNTNAFGINPSKKDIPNVTLMIAAVVFSLFGSAIGYIVGITFDVQGYQYSLKASAIVAILVFTHSTFFYTFLKNIGAWQFLFGYLTQLIPEVDNTIPVINNKTS